MKGFSNYLHRRGLFVAPICWNKGKDNLVPGAFPLSVLGGGGGGGVEERLPRTDSYFRISDTSIHKTMSQPREDDGAK